MGIHVRDNKIVLIADTKTIYFHLPKDVGNDSKESN